ncbi:MAG TPA: ribose 5-phosphate isomerase B [Bryobacteraceae bacterium]|nr:ribose 5-phosphate isomerase B [Bryobacteraceae bacterium]
MRVALGADHAGFVLKQHLRRSLEEKGYEVVDEGTRSPDSCDYPDYAASVARDVAEGRADRGILVCATGVGMSIAANKFRGIRAALGTNLDEVHLLRSHNNANVLTLGAKYINGSMAESLVEAFLTTRFDGGERHVRRIDKIAALENPTPESEMKL